MPTCPAAAKQNDGDKSRENGPGKVTTVSVGQGEPPANLLTVVHNRCKRFLSQPISHKCRLCIMPNAFILEFPFCYKNEDDDEDDLSCGCAT